MIAGFTGCGYRLLGSGGRLPGGLASVRVGDVICGSSDSTIGIRFTDALVAGIIRYPGLSMPDSDTDAAGELRGRVRTGTVETVSRNRGGGRVKQQVRIVTDVRLYGTDGCVLWSGEGLTETAVYVAEGAGAATDADRDAAMTDAMNRLVRRILSGMTADF
ncbi:MAG: hypothetical protein CSA22_07705 [Deltaproteobacteria bacterium]|nr:MAG: hypothetical protein CSA22_07705 [Deltaproteobacteria bacterium]